MIDPAAARELIEAVLRGEPAAREELAARWPEITALVLSDASASAALRDLRLPLMSVGEGDEEGDAGVAGDADDAGDGNGAFDGDGAGVADAADDAGDGDGADTGAYWIAACLAVPHDEPFVAIEPATGCGIAGQLSGIGDNFQLHVLLMDAFPGGEGRRGLLGRRRRRVSERAAAIARGEGPQASDEPVVGAWNPYVYAAYRDGRLPDAADFDSSHLWIWNEGTVADIPQLDGHRVILLGPPAYSRNWTAQRLFDVPATLTARELSEDEVADWLGRIETAAAAAEVPPPS